MYTSNRSPKTCAPPKNNPTRIYLIWAAALSPPVYCFIVVGSLFFCFRTSNLGIFGHCYASYVCFDCFNISFSWICDYLSFSVLFRWRWCFFSGHCFVLFISVLPAVFRLRTTPTITCLIACQ